MNFPFQARRDSAMSYALTFDGTAAAATPDGKKNDPAAGYPAGDLQPNEVQVESLLSGSKRTRSRRDGQGGSEPDPASVAHAIPDAVDASGPVALSDPIVDGLSKALARAEEHLAVALHHNQRILANNANLQALVMTRTAEMEATDDAAHHDELTGLPNRRVFPDRLRQALADAQERQQLIAVVMLDLDGFKHVNDRFGHAAGDLVLGILARRIEAALGHRDQICRYGGDEFVLILADTDRSAAKRTVEKIALQVAAPCGLNGDAVSLTVSAGIAMYPNDGIDVAQLLEAADAAMYRHKPRHEPGHKPKPRSSWFRHARHRVDADTSDAPSG
jgi:diguanylate cyclase (GGDEF)-like protein